MKSTPSTATALASNRRKLRLAGRSSPYVNASHEQPRRDAVHVDAEHTASSPSSQSSNLSPAARRRLIRSQPRQQQQQQSNVSQHSVAKEVRRQPQHLNYDEHDQSLSQLNLHCTDSVDSDDNGTCFNSIGTTTPRHPPSTSSPRKYRDEQQTHLHADLRMPIADEHRNNHQPARRNRQLSPLAEVSPSPHNKTLKPKKESIWESTTSHNRYKSDNNSAYSEFEHWSCADTKDSRQGNRKQKPRGRSRTTRYNTTDAPSDANSVGSSVPTNREEYHNFEDKSPGCGEGEDVSGNDEVDEFLNKPHVKAAIGVGAAATLCGEYDMSFIEKLSSNRPALCITLY